MAIPALRSPVLRIPRDRELRIIEGDGVFLASERGVTRLSGELAASIAQLLDGTRTVDAIVSELTDRYPPAQVREAINRMVASGNAVLQSEFREGAPDDAAGFYEMTGVESSAANRRLAKARVAVYAAGNVDCTELSANLKRSGVGAVSQLESPEEGLADSTLTVVVTDDYVRHDLDRLNRVALSKGTPWMLARPVGAVIWVGPLFRPDITGCWSCLADRVSANRHALTYLQLRLRETEPIGMSAIRHPIASTIGAGLVALEAIKALTGVKSIEDSILTFDLETGRSDRHHFARRPQCPTCGDPTIVAAQGVRPVSLFHGSQEPASKRDRATHQPDNTIVDKFSDQISPITGIVTFLERMPVPDDRLYVFTAGQSMAQPAHDLSSLQWSVEAVSCGKGVTERDARAGAIGEAIERFSAGFQGDEMRKEGTLDQFGDAAIHPNRCMLFSERQYEHRAIWNLGVPKFNWVCEPFDEDEVVEWSPVWSVSGQRTRWLPTQYLYYGYPLRGSKLFAQPDSNGCAAGRSLEAATLRGVYELIERDSAAIWWYNRVRRPGIDLNSFGDHYIDMLQECYAGLGREVWCLDLSSDFGIPAVGAFSRVVDAAQEDILIAFAADLDPRLAVLRALTEMNQYLPAVLPMASGSAPTYLKDAAFASWCRTATLANQPHLVPEARTEASSGNRWNVQSSGDIATDLAYCQSLIESAGLELIVLDQTRPDVGLSVVKVLVPGLRHFWPRFAPGRLFDVPVKLGWTSQKTEEHDLNPVPIFI